MELRLLPSAQNQYPVSGILIQDPSVAGWLREMGNMGLSPEQVDAYAIPGHEANSIWGCLLLLPRQKLPADTGKNSHCQQAGPGLYISSHTALYPQISAEELEQIFGGQPHFFHPDLGLMKLGEAIDWKTLMAENESGKLVFRKPLKGIYLPHEIKSLQVAPQEPEKVLEAMNAQMFPAKETFNDKPLSALEKTKLFLLKGLFGFGLNPGGTQEKEGGKLVEKTGRPKPWLEKLSQLFTPKKTPAWMERLQANYEELEKRNQKELDKLLDLFKSNPMEALRYAIPIDDEGVTRGGTNAEFRLSRRWFDFSLGGGQGSGRFSGGAMLGENQGNLLRQQYLNTAAQLVEREEYEKAAFIYLKLLKQPYTAALTLENGGFYPEAAAIYLNYSKNKEKAAECYEKGNMTQSAIELYKEMQQYEKVGDLYLQLRQRSQANQYYQTVADNYQANKQYIRAALVYRNKMETPERAQAMLLRGWQTDHDAVNCLNNYFTNITDLKELERTIDYIYEKETPPAQAAKLLMTIKYEFDKHPEISSRIRDIAYEIIASRAAQDSEIVSYLKEFNKLDKNIIKDVMRFKQRRSGN